MGGNYESDDDLVMGRVNHAQDPTRLIANSKGHAWDGPVSDDHNADGPVVYVSTGGVSPVAIEADGRHTGPWGEKAAIRALGLEVGIYAECTAVDGKAVDAKAPENSTGVFGRGDPGIHGEAVSEDGAGVKGTSCKGDGVIGTSMSGRGGSFSSTKAAQLHLEPHFGLNSLPCIGELGDMLMVSPLDGPSHVDPDGRYAPSLWLCIKSSVGDGPVEDTAVWARLKFDITHTCQGGVPPSPPQLPSRGDR